MDYIIKLKSSYNDVRVNDIDKVENKDDEYIFWSDNVPMAAFLKREVLGFHKHLPSKHYEGTSLNLIKNWGSEKYSIIGYLGGDYADFAISDNKEDAERGIGHGERMYDVFHAWKGKKVQIDIEELE